MLTLLDILKIKRKGIQVPMEKSTPTIKPITKGKWELVTSNKVGDYCEGENGNNTLLVEFNDFTNIAILDSDAGIAIATKSMWEEWENLALRKTQMRLHLVHT